MPFAELLEADSPAWPDALRELRHDVYHLPGYARLHASLTGGRACAFSYVDGSRQFLLPLVLQDLGGGSSDAASPYGYPGPLSNVQDREFWTAALEALVALLKRREVATLFVRLHPILNSDCSALQQIGTLVQHGDTVSIDLRAPHREIEQHIRANHRRQIDRARRRGTYTVVDRWDLLDPFIDAYYETMTRVGAGQEYFFPRNYFTRLVRELAGSVHLVSALREDAFLAGGLFLTCQGLVQYHLGATWTRALQEQPMKLVFDETWRWARARGDTDLHLGGGVGGLRDSLYHFKAGFSPTRHAFETLRVVVDPAAYERLCLGAGQVPASDLSEYFPSFRRPAHEGAVGLLS